MKDFSSTVARSKGIGFLPVEAKFYFKEKFCKLSKKVMTNILKGFKRYPNNIVKNCLLPLLVK